MKALSQQHILHYIPRKDTPYITFNTRRVETKDIHLVPEIYEIRKKEYEERIEAILEYAQNQQICRSRILLSYFGETDIHDCNQCDVCQRKGNQKSTYQQIEKAAEAIQNFIAEKSQPLNSIYQLPFDIHIIREALEWLVNEGEITVKDGMISLN